MQAGKCHPAVAHTTRWEVSIPESSGTHWTNSTCTCNIQAPPSDLNILGVKQPFIFFGIVTLLHVLGLSPQKVHMKRGAV